MKKNKQSIKIKVTNPNLSIYGKTYEVVKEDSARYYVKILGTWFPIYKENCEVVIDE